MKHIYFILLLVVLGFSSCVIREPEDKVVLVRSGSNILNLIQQFIVKESNMLDKALAVNAFSGKDSLVRKALVEDYLGVQYQMSNMGNVSAISSKFNTVKYLVFRDSLPLDSVGAIWQVKSIDYFSMGVVIKCVGKNKWNVEVYPVDSTYLTQSVLEFSCLDSIKPVLFQKSNFEIKGSGRMVQQNYQYDVFLDFSIEQPLEHSLREVGLRNGRMVINTTNTKDSKSSKTEATYLYVDKGFVVDLVYNKISYRFTRWDNFNLE